MAEPKDMVVPLLKEMRSEINERFDKVDKRLEKLEGGQKSFLNALTADTMMSKFITGDFEERSEALEKKMDQLLKAKN
jgi:hypothetical protein